MDLNKFTEKARNLIQEAQLKVLAGGHQIFMPKHLLKVMIDDESGMTKDLIAACDGNIEAIREDIDRLLQKLPVVEGPGSGHIQLSREMARIL